jgi:hypothetical protein
MVRNVILFYGEEFLAPRPTPKLEDHPLSHYPQLLIQYIRSYPPYWKPFLHPQLRTRHAVVTGTHLS